MMLTLRAWKDFMKICLGRAGRQGKPIPIKSAAPLHVCAIRRVFIFSNIDLKQKPNWLCVIDSRPAGLLLSSGKVQLTSAGVFLPKFQKGAAGGV